MLHALAAPAQRACGDYVTHVRMRLWSGMRECVCVLFLLAVSLNDGDCSEQPVVEAPLTQIVDIAVHALYLFVLRAEKRLINLIWWAMSQTMYFDCSIALSVSSADLCV